MNGRLGGGARGGSGEGVPEALPRAVLRAGRTLGPATIDRIWIFPPLVRGRREWGLLVAACYRGDSSRRLVSARYAAGRTGKGLFLDVELREEGVAPPDRIGRVMDGVARRGPEPLGAPSAVEVGGSEEAFAALIDSYPSRLFEEKPAGTSVPE